MKVAIVGGGVGGLACALSLHAAGIEDVDVYEASAELQELGVGINVLPHAVRELTELGLGDLLAHVAIPTAELVMFNKHGQQIWREPRGVQAGYRWPQYSIHRGQLLGILHGAFCDRFGAERLHTGHLVNGFETGHDAASAAFANGGSVRADLIVGADGVHSAIRAQMYPDEGPPLWNGITMWRGVVDAAPFLTGRSMVMIGNFSRRAVIYPISRAHAERGRSLINVVFEVKVADDRPMPRQDWDHQVDRAEVRSHFGSMSYDWLDVAGMIDAAEQWFQYPMVDRDPLPSWTDRRVVLLGDAAHPMYPVGSNGASQAILDGRTLAHELALHADIDDALAAYENLRRSATSAVVLANRQVGAEQPMELVEALAPDGFADIDDVISHDELVAMSQHYKRLAGFDPSILNERPSLSISR